MTIKTPASQDPPPPAATGEVTGAFPGIEFHAWPQRFHGGQQVAPRVGLLAIHTASGLAVVIHDEDRLSLLKARRVAAERLAALVAIEERQPPIAAGRVEQGVTPPSDEDGDLVGELVELLTQVGVTSPPAQCPRIDLPTIRGLAPERAVVEDLGNGRTLIVVHLQTASGASRYAVWVDEGELVASLGARRPERAWRLVKRLRREWSR